MLGSASPEDPLVRAKLLQLAKRGTLRHRYILRLAAWTFVAQVEPFGSITQLFWPAS
jgi:hypothetical protein